jgi:hypothetical protein
MAILKDGSYVVVEGRGVGKVEMYNFMQDFSLVRFKNDMPMSSMVRKESMTPIDPAFDVLLTSVNK